MNRYTSQSPRSLTILLTLAVLQPCIANETSSPIVDVRFDSPYQQVEPSVGDQWAPTWGPGDVLYTGNDDGNSFGGMAINPIAFGELTGSDPSNLKGTTVNAMDDYREPRQFGPEDALWRAHDDYELAGRRYRFAACSASGSADGWCLVASADAGKTWRKLTVNSDPVFPTANPGRASIITLRRDREAEFGEVGRYIYAAQYTGVINGDDHYFIGRVPRDKFPAGNRIDWLFLQSDGSWKNTLETPATLVNTMTLGPDDANWKIMNAYSIDGVLYAFVTRCRYPWSSGDLQHRHVFANSSIIMSTDRGHTWTRPAQANYSKPMFPGTRFGAPYFVWYGKDGAASVDNADRYVYAVSNNGHFEAGDDYVLGRVPRTKLSELSAGDWTFYKAGDGLRSESWTPELQHASPILTHPGQSSMTGMTYIAGLHRYVMVVWHYNQVSFAIGMRKYDLGTQLEFFEAPKPWGPWTRVKTFQTGRLGWYTPVIGQRFQTLKDPSTVQAILYAAGYRTKPEGGLDGSLYKLNYMPITLSTKPLPQADPTFVGGR